AWIDCLSRHGRGVLHCGRWCEPAAAPRRFPAPKRARSIPFHAPAALLNGLTVGAFNTLVYGRHRATRGVLHPAAFFYPLDVLQHWPRLYGRRGFTQHQCVLPDADAAAVGRFLDVVRAAGGRPFLAVLKDFGAEGEGLLSFPRPGLTLALDFAVGPRTPAL